MKKWMDKALLHWRSCGGGKQANLCERHFYAPITIRHIIIKQNVQFLVVCKS